MKSDVSELSDVTQGSIKMGSILKTTLKIKMPKHLN